MGWCQLRQLAIHPDLVGELWCHHWTARPARLPVVAPHSDGLADATAGGNRQLTLAALLPQH